MDREENHLEHLVAEGMAVAGKAYLVACLKEFEEIVLVLLVAVVGMVVEIQVEMEERIEHFPVAFASLAAYL